MLRVLGSARLARITGADSINHTTSSSGITATDLGICWQDGHGGVFLAFGDTYGTGWGGYGAGPDTADWRRNTLAHSTNTDLEAGVRFDWVWRRADGCAGQVLDRDDAVTEATVIPTSGIAVNGMQVVHYMSVRRWGVPGVWQTNYSGLAFSTDSGRTWRKSRTAVWPNGQHSLLSRFRRREPGGHPLQLAGFAGVRGDWLYVLGTPNGRYGAAYLAAVPVDEVLDAAAYRYWSGAEWLPDARCANAVFPAPVGELSVDFHDYLGLWLATHLDERRAAIVVRSAPELTGPWSAGEVLVSGLDYPGLYGGFQHPWPRNRPVLYFTLAQWGTYNVELFRADLVA